MGLRWAGMAVIAIVAPVVAILFPALATVSGAIAALWAFLGRTSILQQEKRIAERAATVQERFDFNVYSMPSSVPRSSSPSIEDVVALTGDDATVAGSANKQKLRDWYPFDLAQSGKVSVAICQRANVSYTDRLLRTTANLWVWIMGIWAVALVATSIVMKLDVATVLLGIALPLLPAFLDIYDYWRSIRRAAKDRRDLMLAIEAKLASNASEIEDQDLMVWQNQLYELRRVAPQVPDFVYWINRKTNELAMNRAAEEISNDVNGNGG